MNGIKNMETATVLTLKDRVAYQPGQVVSKTLAQNNALSVTLFCLRQGARKSARTSRAVMPFCERASTAWAESRLTAWDFTLHEGESIVMPRAPSACGLRAGTVQNAAGRRLFENADAKTQKRLQSEQDCIYFAYREPGGGCFAFWQSVQHSWASSSAASRRVRFSADVVTGIEIPALSSAETDACAQTGTAQSSEKTAALRLRQIQNILQHHGSLGARVRLDDGRKTMPSGLDAETIPL